MILQEQFKKLVEIEERIAEGLQGESLATASRVITDHSFDAVM